MQCDGVGMVLLVIKRYRTIIQDSIFFKSIETLQSKSKSVSFTPSRQFQKGIWTQLINETTGIDEMAKHLIQHCGN